MKPHVTVITLAVDDLERSLVFYRDGLGLKTSGITGTQYPIGAWWPITSNRKTRCGRC